MLEVGSFKSHKCYFSYVSADIEHIYLNGIDILKLYLLVFFLSEVERNHSFIGLCKSLPSCLLPLP